MIRSFKLIPTRNNASHNDPSDNFKGMAEELDGELAQSLYFIHIVREMSLLLMLVFTRGLCLAHKIDTPN
jgi:hypothetical protein